MADMTMMQKIAAALTGGKNGLASYGSPAYRMYAQEAVAMGRKPLPEADWMQLQQQTAPEQQAAPMPQQPPAQPFRF